MKATTRKVPTGLLAQEEPEAPPPPLQLPRIPHAVGVLGNHEELMNQIGQEADGALESLEIAELFTCVEASKPKHGCHNFVASWSEDALKSQGFDPVPPRKTSRPCSNSSMGTPRSRVPSREGAKPHSHAPQSHVPAARRSSDTQPRAASSVASMHAHQPPNSCASPHPHASPRSRPGTGGARHRSGATGTPRQGARGAGEEEGSGVLRWQESRVAPVMQYMEQRTQLEMVALESEFERLMAYGDGTCSLKPP